MDDIQSAQLQSDGSLTSVTRVFRFWERPKNYRPFLTRLDWTAPDGQTYAFTYEPDTKLRDLADEDPVAAAKELSRRFAICSTDAEHDYSTIYPVLAALAIRHYYMHDAQHKMSIEHPVAIVDPWTDTFTLVIDGGDPINTDIPATRRFNMGTTSLEGRKTDYQLLMDPDSVEGYLGYGNPLTCLSPDQIIRLAAEVNAILRDAGLPLIDDQTIQKVASRDDVHHHAIIQLERHLIDPTTQFVDGFDIFLDAKSQDIPHILAALADLATTTSVQGDLIETANGPYRIMPETDFPQHLLLIKEGDDPQTSEHMVFIWRGDLGAVDANDTKTVDLLRSLQSRIIQNLAPAEVESTSNLCKILALATQELAFARQAETHRQELPFAGTAVSNLTGMIEIRVGSDYVIKTGEGIVRPPVLTVDGEDVSGIGAYYTEMTMDEPVCGMAAIGLRASAEAVFARLIIDARKVEAAIDSYYGFDKEEDEA